MEHYVTIFDSLFLPQGLALHASMQRHLNHFTLWIICVDDEALEVLRQLDLQHVRLLQLNKIETPQLLSVKAGRDKGEYCWTLTPFAPRFVFDADNGVERVTYIDADIWFRSDPDPIFEEFDQSGKAVLITEHAFAPEHDASAASGRFCVQFITFRKNDGEEVRKSWEHQCLEWCYRRLEDGKFGDQKYLDDWPRVFKNQVHILKNKELCLAPWNVTRFPYGNSVMYHFHGLRIVSARRLGLGDYPVPRVVLKNIYAPYAAELRSAISRLEGIGFSIRPQQKPASKLAIFLKFYRSLKRRLWTSSSISF